MGDTPKKSTPVVKASKQSKQSKERKESKTPKKSTKESDVNLKKSRNETRLFWGMLKQLLPMDEEKGRLKTSNFEIDGSQFKSFNWNKVAKDIDEDSRLSFDATNKRWERLRDHMYREDKRMAEEAKDEEDAGAADSPQASKKNKGKGKKAKAQPSVETDEESEEEALGKSEKKDKGKGKGKGKQSAAKVEKEDSDDNSDNEEVMEKATPHKKRKLGASSVSSPRPAKLLKTKEDKKGDEENSSKHTPKLRKEKKTPPPAFMANFDGAADSEPEDEVGTGTNDEDSSDVESSGEEGSDNSDHDSD